jgi:hypothetical protein
MLGLDHVTCRPARETLAQMLLYLN